MEAAPWKLQLFKINFEKLGKYVMKISSVFEIFIRKICHGEEKENENFERWIPFRRQIHLKNLYLIHYHPGAAALLPAKTPFRAYSLLIAEASPCCATMLKVVGWSGIRPQPPNCVTVGSIPDRPTIFKIEAQQTSSIWSTSQWWRAFLVRSCCFHKKLASSHFSREKLWKFTNF